MNKFLKILISLALALIVSVVFMQVIVISIMGQFDKSLWKYFILPIFIFSLPIYVIIKKNLFN